MGEGRAEGHTGVFAGFGLYDQGRGYSARKEVLVGKKSVEDIYDEDVLQRVNQRRKETEFYEKFR